MAKFSNIVVDIPADAFVVSGRVYVITESRYCKERQYNMDSRLTIGWVNDSSKKTMNPNSNYVARYPREFNAAANGKLAPVTKRCGLYLLSLALSQANGLYSTLVECCGPETANAIMDFANYSILFKSNVAKDYEHLMADQLLYSEKLYSDTWLSERFEKHLTQSQQEDFKDKWVRACTRRGITNVWLCIDGSNNDCLAKEVEYAEKGKAKSHKNCNICSYMYAVDAISGTPITERLYRGGRVDSKEFIEMMDYLRRYSIKVEGVILDRGFCDVDCLELIIGLKLKYIIMLKENTHGFKTMYNNHADEIRMKSRQAIGNGIYAISDECRIFSKLNQLSWITLAYDSRNGIERANHLYDKVQAAVSTANEALRVGHKASIDKSVKPYVTPIINDGAISRYEIHHDSLQAAMDEKGFCAVAADSDYGAIETLKKYDLRDKSEKQYMVVKTHLGGGVFRTHYTNGVSSKGFVAFIASIIRHEIGQICEQTKNELTVALRESNFICVQRTPDNTYMGVHNMNERQLALFAAANLEQGDIDYVALEESRRVNGTVHDQVHKLPVHDQAAQETQAKRGPGRPKGSTKKDASEVVDDTVKRMRGRPKGARNKPRSGSMQSTSSEKQNSTSEKRGPGRPKGSKNRNPAVNAKEKRRMSKLNDV